MAYIRTLEKLPSGIDGWYIYDDSTKKKTRISSPEWENALHTLEDVKFIRDILNEVIKKNEESPNE